MSFARRNILLKKITTPSLLTVTLTNLLNQKIPRNFGTNGEKSETKKSVESVHKIGIMSEHEPTKMGSEMPSIVRSSCIFCNIVSKLENTEILYEDEEVCVFRDIKPASDYHILTIPKRHIEDAKCLSSDDKNLVEKMLQTAKDLLAKNNLSAEDARFGYHWPPFRSVRHLHLHTIAPESKMGIAAKIIFMKNSYWFVSPEYVTSRLSADS